MRDEIKGLQSPNPTPLSAVSRELPLPYTPRAKRAIENALEEAQPLKEGGRRIDAGDLLIGLFCEQEGVAAQVLMNHGLTLDALRSEIERVNRSGK
jgi:ATP-dependent Clp protease ATP-binding subunit ClpA